MLAAALTALSATARGQQALEFDPAFLELGGGQGGADLSVYATSNRVLPGVYPISVFVNGEAIERRDITFVSESARDGREDAIPCLSARMFDEWGVDIAAFAKLAQAGDLPDFFGPFQSWRTASVASVEQYR
ncbi:FimD/PapC N-terminal domain-containing protein, partial [Burkholderia pseudomallei]|uniref:FimD/PapC N-terminal domain-containing protein n=1 Tax=Burkholderia pseudomallei TaxID=28450 RepID=UPI00218099CE